eukprot:13959004-Alexandrium_andersonii.AAC.1
MATNPRHSSSGEERTIPEVAIDECFLTKDGLGVAVTALVMQGHTSRAILARPVLRKGRTFEDAVGAP